MGFWNKAFKKLDKVLAKELTKESKPKAKKVGEKGYVRKPLRNEKITSNFSNSKKASAEKEYIYIYVADLTLNTPKWIIEYDGTTIEGNEEPELIGDPNGFSEDGRPYNAFGFWVTKMNSKILRDMGYDPYKESPTSRPNRDIGLYKSPSKFENEWKDFLLKFRDIVESKKSIDEKISEINKTKDKKEIWKKIQKMNKDNNRDPFPLSFFLDELIKLEGVGLKTAKLLWEANLKSSHDVLNASDEKLLQIKGIGKSLIEKIRNSKNY